MEKTITIPVGFQCGERRKHLNTVVVYDGMDPIADPSHQVYGKIKGLTAWIINELSTLLMPVECSCSVTSLFHKGAIEVRNGGKILNIRKVLNEFPTFLKRKQRQVVRTKSTPKVVHKALLYESSQMLLDIQDAIVCRHLNVLKKMVHKRLGNDEGATEEQTCLDCGKRL